MYFSTETIARAAEIARAADEGGTISPQEAIRLFGRANPQLHRWMSLAEAWHVAFGDIDTDKLSEALWG